MRCCPWCAFSFLPERGGLWIQRRRSAFFIWQFVAFLTLCLETGELDALFFYAFSQITLFASMMLFLMIYPGMNRALLNHMCFLLGTGFLILGRLNLQQAIRQLIIAAAGLLISMAVPYVVRNWEELLKNLTLLYAGGGFLALSAVLILGQVTHGSRISYTVAGITFQPSEFVKLLFVFFLAAFLWEDTSLKNLTIAAAAAGAHVLVLVLSRDLGSALIFFLVFVFLVFFATGKYRYLALGTAGGCVAAWVAYRLFSHVQVRVQAWRDPWSVIDGQGYQITQSLFALSRGGWFGLGIGQGTPQDIPYVETDFIFAAVTEELGLLFSVSLLVVCVCCFLQMMRIALGSFPGNVQGNALVQQDRFLPPAGVRIWSNVYFPGVSDCGRRNPFYPPHRRDAASGQLWRKQRDDHASYVRSGAGHRPETADSASGG